MNANSPLVDVSVPFADLHAQYASIKSELDDAIASVINSSAFIRGPYVESFESDFAAAAGRSHCVSCANGTDALYIAMHALGVKPGDEIIVPAMSWISTSETVTQAGGTVVFCDIDPETYTLDPADLEAKITPRTVGIIPVHLYGQPADMPRIMTIAHRHGLWVIEDCAQSHLSRINGHLAGTFGVAATYSFYPGKNLGAMGDAGAIVSDDPALVRKMAMYARHGGIVKGDHEIEGVNSRLDGLQAAILSVKLKHLPAWTERRRSIATDYSNQLAAVKDIELPKTAQGREHVWHLYVIKSGSRDTLASHLKARGVQTQLNYPRALPYLPCYARLAHTPADFPVAHRLGLDCLSLPIFPEMTERQMRKVSQSVHEFFQA